VVEPTQKSLPGFTTEHRFPILATAERMRRMMLKYFRNPLVGKRRLLRPKRSMISFNSIIDTG
jgi:hypothetical protein